MTVHYVVTHEDIEPPAHLIAVIPVGTFRLNSFAVRTHNAAFPAEYHGRLEKRSFGDVRNVGEPEI